MDSRAFTELAGRYTAAWNSGKPERVAGFFAEGATLSVNGVPATGRAAIAETAGGFMTAFPDLELIDFEPLLEVL